MSEKDHTCEATIIRLSIPKIIVDCNLLNKIESKSGGDIIELGLRTIIDYIIGLQYLFTDNDAKSEDYKANTEVMSIALEQLDRIFAVHNTPNLDLESEEYYKNNLVDQPVQFSDTAKDIANVLHTKYTDMKDRGDQFTNMITKLAVYAAIFKVYWACPKMKSPFKNMSKHCSRAQNLHPANSIFRNFMNYMYRENPVLVPMFYAFSLLAEPKFAFGLPRAVKTKDGKIAYVIRGLGPDIKMDEGFKGSLEMYICSYIQLCVKRQLYLTVIKPDWYGSFWGVDMAPAVVKKLGRFVITGMIGTLEDDIGSLVPQIDYLLFYDALDKKNGGEIKYGRRKEKPDA